VSGASGRDPVEDFDVISEELRLFDPRVAAKPQVVAANKIDALDDASRASRLERHVRRQGLKCIRISGVTGEGMETLLEEVWRRIAAARDEQRSLDVSDHSEGIDLIGPARGRRDR
jgi:GTPase